jgi:hypothetical protein
MTDQAFQPARPADRYGDRPPSLRRRVLVVVGVGGVLLVALIWWIWVASTRSSPEVSYDLLGFDAVTTTSVEIRFSVAREPGEMVACVLRARAADGREVGRRQVVVPADPVARVELTSTVRTTGPAVTGEVLSCAPYTMPLGVARTG